MSFVLSKRSLGNLEGVHPDLVKVVHRAIQITEVDFVVTSGVRTLAQQEELVAKGASKTMKSRHLTGHAVDVAALLEGNVVWAPFAYRRVAQAFKRAAYELGVKIVWGGDWEKFVDMPHFELDRSAYPEPQA